MIQYEASSFIPPATRLRRTGRLTSALLSLAFSGALLVVLAMFGSASARAQALADRPRADRPAIQGARPEFHLSVGGHGDFGAGMRLDIPVVSGGFLSNGRDEFALSPGIDLQFVDFTQHDEEDDDLLLMPQLAAQWNFYFRRGWSIFPELGLALVIGDDHHGYSSDDDEGADVHADGLVAFGARRHFSKRTALLLRAGWPNGLQLGFTI